MFQNLAYLIIFVGVLRKWSWYSFFVCVAWNVEVFSGGGSNCLRDANYYPDQFRTTLYFPQKLAGSARCKSQVVCERNFGGKLLNYLLSRVIQHNLAINREKIDHKSVSFRALRNSKDLSQNENYSYLHQFIDPLITFYCHRASGHSC